MAEFRPLYTQVKEDLYQRILSKEWSPGEFLPSEQSLAEEYQVSHGTLRKALDKLVEEQLLTRHQGKGTAIAKHTQDQALYRFFHLYNSRGERVLPAETVSTFNYRLATAEERGFLGLKNKKRILEIKRIRIINNRPAILEIVIVDPLLLPIPDRISEENMPNTLYDFYQKEFGVTVAKTREIIKACVANDEDKKSLRVASNTPMLQIERVALDIENKPVEYRLTRCVSEDYHFEIGLS